jgi:hypothetical protein
MLTAPPWLAWAQPHKASGDEDVDERVGPWSARKRAAKPPKVGNTLLLEAIEHSPASISG